MTDIKTDVINPRSAARLAAVQALYQLSMSESTPARIITEFRHHRLGKAIEGGDDTKVEDAWFADVVDGTSARSDEIDALIITHLSQGWTLKRLDKSLLQILRAASYELLARVDVPTSVIISEYVDVAKAFFDRAEASFVNGVLDAEARALGRIKS